MEAMKIRINKFSGYCREWTHVVSEECVGAEREEIRMCGVQEDWKRGKDNLRKAVFKFHTAKVGSHHRYLEGGRNMKRCDKLDDSILYALNGGDESWRDHQPCHHCSIPE